MEGGGIGRRLWSSSQIGFQSREQKAYDRA